MTSHVDSNMVGKDGTETITNFATIGDTSAALVGATVTSSGAVSGTTITGSGAVSGTTITGSTGVIGTSYVKVAGVYLMSGAVPTNTSASILDAAVALVSAPVPKGSMFMNASPGALWVFTATMTAATVT